VADDATRTGSRVVEKLDRLDANIGAAAVELTAGDLREIDCDASGITLQGARYPEHLERVTGR
jgi:hypothetical protein